MLDPTLHDPTLVGLDIGFFLFVFVISAWMTYDTRGALARLFFFKRDLRLSAQMIRFLRIDAGVVATGSLYVLLSHLLRFRTY